jgi:ribonuclease P protein component
VLAKTNRIVRANDYRAVVRRGTRFPAPHTLSYIRVNSGQESARFGFIVGKTVGSAPVRNLVRRRLKAAAFELLAEVPAGADVVIRALPNSAQASWATLHQEISNAVHRAGTR